MEHSILGTSTKKRIMAFSAIMTVLLFSLSGCEMENKVEDLSSKMSATQSSIDETDPEFVSIIWEGNLEIQGGRPAGQEIKVTYSYTEDGKMRASFLDVGSGNSKDIDLSIDASKQTIDDLDINQFKVE